MNQKGKHTAYGVKISSCLVLCALVLACGSSKQCKAPEDQGTAAQMTDAEAEKAYRQMALYIQEGFRTYDIEGTYQAYFAPVDSRDYYKDGSLSVDILLDGTDGAWMERIHCSYNIEKDWYTFSGIFEPIFTKNTYYYEFNGYYETDSDSDFVKEMLEDHVYTTEISKTKETNLPVRYDSENGPMEYDDRKITPIDEEPGGYIQSYLYSYYDDRMDIYITIDYPHISKDNDLEAQINSELRKAFLSFYDSEIHKESEINPAKVAYGLINRNYIITRADESYLSIRIFTYSDFRASAHPSTWENGITINMKTGEVLCLQDVVGESWTPISLLDTGRFHIEPQEKYSEATNEQWFQMLHEDWERNDRYSVLTTLDSEFYLTPDSLGLITSLGNEYMRIEAPFTDLGITFP